MIIMIQIQTINTTTTTTATITSFIYAEETEKKLIPFRRVAHIYCYHHTHYCDEFKQGLDITQTHINRPWSIYRL